MKRLLVILGGAAVLAIAAVVVVMAVLGNQANAAADTTGDTSPGTQHASRTNAENDQALKMFSILRLRNMGYHGGPVMHTSTTYAIFWFPSGSTYSSTYQSLIQRYFQDVGGSGIYNTNTQYTDKTNGHILNSSTFGGAYVDTAAYPSGSLSDSQIQQEVSRAMSAKNWTGGLTHLFFVYTAKGENICIGKQCSFTTFCGYHSNFGNNILYAAMPYTGTDLKGCGVKTSPNNDIEADSEINVTSHEHMEAVTDPLGTAWYDHLGNENGDKCAFSYGSMGSNGADITMNGHPYIVQREWDNKTARCAITGP